MAVFDEDEDWALSVAVQETKHLMSNSSAPPASSTPPPLSAPLSALSSAPSSAPPPTAPPPSSTQPHAPSPPHSPPQSSTLYSTSAATLPPPILLPIVKDDFTAKVSPDIIQLQSVQDALYECLSPISNSSTTFPKDVSVSHQPSPAPETSIITNPSSLPPPPQLPRTHSSSSSSSSSSVVAAYGPHPVQGLLDYVRTHHLPYPSYAYDVSAPHLGVRVSVSCGSIQSTVNKASKKAAKAEASFRLLETLKTLSVEELNQVREKALRDAVEGGGGGGGATTGIPVVAEAETTTTTTTTPGDAEASTPQNEDDSVKSEEISLMNKHLNTVLTECSSDTIQVQRQDPNSPLYSCTTFEQLNLPPSLLKGIYSLGYNQPSKIQETALPLLLGNPPHNLIAQSQSGTGKTAAFVIAMLSKIDPALKHPQALILSPTYELAQQTGKVIEDMARFLTGVSCIYSVRGNNQPRGSKLTQQIVIGTPGTTLDWALKLKFFDPRLIKVFILDEADVMIDTQGHQDQSIRIHRSLRKETTTHMLFSATYTPEVISFAERVIPDPVVLRLMREQQSVENIKSFYISCHAIEDKLEALINIYGTITIGQAIIFCKTRKDASWLASKLRQEGHLVGLLSGELEIHRRADVINRFRRGNEKILISTNVSARGIDVAQVTVVVNFDLPTKDKTGEPDYDTYLHRIGRTGRFGKKGIAITMVGGSRDIANIQKIEKHFGRPIDKLNAEDIDELEKLENI